MHRKPWLLRGLITVTVAVAIALTSQLGMAQSPFPPLASSLCWDGKPWIGD